MDEMNRIIILAGVALCLAGPAYAQQCLHGPEETPEQKTRRQQALTAARAVNTIQANHPSPSGQRFWRHEQLAVSLYALREAEWIKPINLTPGQDVMPGWALTLDATNDGYWFIVKDKMDPCGFAYISNTTGLIYTAEPMR
jgi:hypothetical protein